MENRRWLIIPSNIVEDIDFNEVYETSADTLRYSLDGSKTFVKYDILLIEETYTETLPNPETGEDTFHEILAGTYGRPSIYNSTYVEYTHSEILEILNNSEWTSADTLE